MIASFASVTLWPTNFRVVGELSAKQSKIPTPSFMLRRKNFHVQFYGLQLIFGVHCYFRVQLLLSGPPHAM